MASINNAKNVKNLRRTETKCAGNSLTPENGVNDTNILIYIYLNLRHEMPVLWAYVVRSNNRTELAVTAHSTAVPTTKHTQINRIIFHFIGINGVQVYLQSINRIKLRLINKSKTIHRSWIIHHCVCKVGISVRECVCTNTFCVSAYVRAFHEKKKNKQKV